MGDLKGLNELNRLRLGHGSSDDYYFVKKLLEALDLVTNKNVDMYLLRTAFHADNSLYFYNRNAEEPLTVTQFELLKEALYE